MIASAKDGSEFGLWIHDSATRQGSGGSLRFWSICVSCQLNWTIWFTNSQEYKKYRHTKSQTWKFSSANMFPLGPQQNVASLNVRSRLATRYLVKYRSDLSQWKSMWMTPLWRWLTGHFFYHIISLLGTLFSIVFCFDFSCSCPTNIKVTSYQRSQSILGESACEWWPSWLPGQGFHGTYHLLAGNGERFSSSSSRMW